MWGGGNDNGNWKRERQVRSKQTLCFNFFSRKVIFTFKFLEDTVFTFTSLVLKEDNLNSSVSISNFRDFYYFVLIYYYILFVVCFYKISFFHSNNQSLKLSEFVSLWAWVRDHSFMFAQRGRGLTKFWATLQMIVDGFWGESIFLILSTFTPTNSNLFFPSYIKCSNNCLASIALLPFSNFFCS